MCLYAEEEVDSESKKQAREKSSLSSPPRACLQASFFHCTHLVSLVLQLKMGDNFSKMIIVTMCKNQADKANDLFRNEVKG